MTSGIVAPAGNAFHYDTSGDLKHLTVRKEDTKVSEPDSIDVNRTILVNKKPAYATTNGALLLTRFQSLEDLKKVVEIEYIEGISSSFYVMLRKPLVRLTHSSGSYEVSSVLKSGVSQSDFMHARDGGFWDRAWLALNSPYSVVNKNDMLRIYFLARRKRFIFGGGDVAFYDLALTMMYNISDADLALIPSKDLSEKGYINSFNHITAQAFMTSIFSERMADFIADIHERYQLPELINGKFNEYQLSDLDDGPVDNYVDIINNEWGQELGKQLRKKYNINRETYWTPELLTNYLNDIQSYYSWAFQIGFNPFRTEDELVIRFSDKINRVMDSVSGLK